MCCGGGGDNMPSPDEMGRAQARYNRIDQYTPFGSLEFQGADRNQSVQSFSPQMLDLMNSMMGARQGAMGQLMERMGGTAFDFQNPTAPPSGGGNTRGKYPYVDEDGVPTNVPPGVNAIGADGLIQQGGIQTGNIPPGGGDGYGGPGDYGGGGYRQDINDGGGKGRIPQSYDDFRLDPRLNLDDSTSQEDRKRYEQAFMDRQRGLLDPIFSDQQAALDERMANRGMPTGGEEGEILQGRLGTERAGAFEKAALDSILFGGSEVRADRGMNLNEKMAQFGATSQARNQLFGEDTMQFNQLASVLGLTPTPSAAGDSGGFFGPSPVDMMSPYALQAQMQQANQGFGGDILGGLLGLGGQLGGAYLGGRG